MRSPLVLLMVMWGYNAVSYTHLDVYKRQTLTRAYLKLQNAMNDLLSYFDDWLTY